MERSCRLRCRCLVTPRAVSSCNANCRPEDCTAWTKLGSSLKQIDSTMIGHSASFQVCIRFPSLLFYLCLSVAGKLLLGPVIFIFRHFSVCLSPLDLFSSTLTNYPSPVLWHGRASIPNRMSFLSNKIVP